MEVLPAENLGVGVEMTIDEIKKMLKKYEGYTSALHINDKLFLHYRGFGSIKNLEVFTQLRCLWLEGNGLTKIEGLESCTELRSIYLQENLFEKIEGLSTLRNLVSLNLNQNSLRRIDGLSSLRNLETLLLEQNYLQSKSDVEHLLECPSLTTVSLKNNKIDDVAAVDDVIVKMENLAVIYLLGNPVVKKVRHYKKSITARVPKMRYIDDRPVFEDDRRRAEAFWRAFTLEGDAGGDKAGRAAERAELDAIRREKAEAEERNHQAFEDLIVEARRKREANGEYDSDAEAEANDRGDTFVNHSGETCTRVPESEGARKWREMRWLRMQASYDLRHGTAGARVTTAYGDGAIVRKRDDDGMYEVQLPFGVAFVQQGALSEPDLGPYTLEEDESDEEQGEGAGEAAKPSTGVRMNIVDADAPPVDDEAEEEEARRQRMAAAKARAAAMAPMEQGTGKVSELLAGASAAAANDAAPMITDVDELD